ncbi:MAG TPA: glycine cleavage system protein GcvH [Coprothermobacter proteolyticus]|uniref:glycine cleavage system protein GcvH n=1 Tax=Coprothermobacter proteolyticus TaxID=35786 RepID=UPI000B215556|nr:glycine cleavage system protein GcvH [Coprothermobacter proteolyticus]MBK6585586.1 glycine cleavage system protein GcvH [Coprothermobacter sp.]MBP8983750.1 glycine cleavage system protein GcvH [Coprothermobacter sp.]NLT84029.1 glycine cleavage system protein GcvH [Coprothermobacter proteolyticus]HOA64842.1 glycine cleavage system protein GcvH [Coprothermobacter proteolyticus]HOP45694.1 glycine cleavage system protein GcvH [Coprothermobacter proteolyticus]
MKVLEGLKYSKEHEWVKVLEGNKVSVGITDFAQDELGDIVFVNLPAVGQEIKVGETLASLESVKSASDVYSPVSGKVVEVNEKLKNSPEIINDDPYGEGWIAVIELSDVSVLDTLMSAEEYKQFIGE